MLEDPVPDGWTCPDCRRRFARRAQSHECAPAMDLEEYFSTGPPHERPVCEAVIAFLRTLGPVHVEPVSVGIFVKKAGSFVELRPMTRWVAMSFPLPRRVHHRLITRKPYDAGHRIYNIVNLRTPDDLDDEIRGWLAESYGFVE
ncbi:MAG TPA: DUF5655 domain-containing protein [Acidimicrobiales bacterium]